MSTINIHKAKLLPAAFAYQQARLKEIVIELEKMIDKEMSRTFFRPKSRIAADRHLSKQNFEYMMFGYHAKEATDEYVKLQTACRVADDGIVSLDIDVVQRLFKE